MSPDKKNVTRFQWCESLFPELRFIEPISFQSNTVTLVAQKNCHKRFLVKIPVSREQAPTAGLFLAHEWDMTRDFRVEGLLCPAEILRKGEICCLLYPDYGGRPVNYQYSEVSKNITSFLQMACEATQILSRIHRHGLVHGQISADSLLYNLQSGQVKICCPDKFSSFSRKEGKEPVCRPNDSGPSGKGERTPVQEDLLALGVVLFETLAKDLPFGSAVDLSSPESVLLPEVRSDVFPMLWAVIRRLLASDPSARYRTAQGAYSDLLTCTKNHFAGRSYEKFFLGKSDHSGEISLCSRLWGRSLQLAGFEKDWQQVQQGGFRMVLVRGEAGVGKTSLVFEAGRIAVEGNGQFGYGKFSQFETNTPYQGVINAFSQIATDRAAKGADEIQKLRVALIESVGGNLPLLQNLVPGLSHFFPDSGELPDLQPDDSRVRLNLALRGFLKAFAQDDCPLFIFLDDLQWADPATLVWLENITACGEKNILIAGGFRVDDIDYDQPVGRLWKNHEVNDGSVRLLHLFSLDRQAVGNQLTDMLRASVSRFDLFVRQVYEKTSGNPFYVNHLLNTLYSKGGLWLENPENGWFWNQRIFQGLPAFENADSVLQEEINRLSPISKELLVSAAWIGMFFDAELLARVMEKDIASVVQGLADAEKWRLIFKENVSRQQTCNRYRFAHDQVFSVARKMAHPQTAKRIRFAAGMAMFEQIRTEDDFRTGLGHLNASMDLIENSEMRMDLAKANLDAGKHDRKSAAFSSAFEYFRAGLKLVGPGVWEKDYALALELTMELAGVAGLTGRHEIMHALVRQVATKGRNSIDRAQAKEILVSHLINKNHLDEAFLEIKKILKDLSISVPNDVGSIRLGIAFWQAKRTLKKIAIACDGESSEEADPRILTALSIMTKMSDVAYSTRPQLFAYLCTRILSLSAKSGITPFTPMALAMHALSLSFRGQVDQGYKVGEIALKLQEKHPDHWSVGVTLLLIYGFVFSWNEHWKNMQEGLKLSVERSMSAGNYEFAALSGFVKAYVKLFCGEPLKLVEREIQNVLKNLRFIGERRVVCSEMADLCVVHELMGKKEKDISWQQVREFAEIRSSAKELILFEYTYHFDRLFVEIYMGRYRRAVIHAEKMEANEWAGKGSPAMPVAAMNGALARLGKKSFASRKAGLENENMIFVLCSRLEKWSRYAPMNIEHKYHLVKAEICRVRGEKDQAIRYYELARNGAHAHGFLSEEALTEELMAMFYFTTGTPDHAKEHYRKARSLYTLWGADAKVKDMDKKYDLLFW